MDAADGRAKAAVAVIVEDGNLLIAHRFPHAHLPDLWEFPGGKIHPGETPEACAVREVEEELGISIELLGLLLQRPYDYADRKVDLWFFVARRLAGEPLALGCQRWKWVRPEDLKRYPLPDASLPVLEALRQGGWLPPGDPPAAAEEGARRAVALTRCSLPARLLRAGMIGRAAWEVVLEPSDPAGLCFLAGQHVEVEIPGTRERLARHLSIASPPSSRHALALCVRLVEGDPFLAALQALGPGALVCLTGPLGDFRVHEETGRPRLFVATGTGITPLRSMVLDRAYRGDRTRSILLFGTRGEGDLLYEQDFRALDDAADWFTYHPILSRPETEAWRGLRGRIPAALSSLFSDLSGWDAYLCGGSEPLRDIGAMLDRLGQPRPCRYQEGWGAPEEHTPDAGPDRAADGVEDVKVEARKDGRAGRSR